MSRNSPLVVGHMDLLVASLTNRTYVSIGIAGDPIRKIGVVNVIEAEDNSGANFNVELSTFGRAKFFVDLRRADCVRVLSKDAIRMVDRVVWINHQS